MAQDENELEGLRSVSNMEAIHTIDHYLYFPTKDIAHKVLESIRELGFDTEERPGVRGDWLILATSRFVPTESKMAEVRERLEQIAEENFGEYDGWEAEVVPITRPESAK